MYKNSHEQSALCHAPVVEEGTLQVDAGALPSAFLVHHQTYTAHYTSLDLLQDESTARAYVYARAALAETIARTIEWVPVEKGVSRGRYRSLVFDRDISGHNILKTATPIWGVLHLGRTVHQLQSEAQLIAYIMARFHSIPSTKGAL